MSTSLSKFILIYIIEENPIMDFLQNVDDKNERLHSTQIVILIQVMRNS